MTTRSEPPAENEGLLSYLATAAHNERASARALPQFFTLLERLHIPLSAGRGRDFRPHPLAWFMCS